MFNFFGQSSSFFIQVGPCTRETSSFCAIVSPLVPRTAGFISLLTCLHVLVVVVSRIIETLFETKIDNFFSEDKQSGAVLESDHM